MKIKSVLERRLVVLCLVLVVVIGFGWRYFLVSKNNSFLFDEAWDFIQANSFSLSDFIKGQYWDISLHPPLHYIFFHFWSKIRIDEFFLRIPFVFAGSLSVLFFYFVAKEILRSKKFGLLACLLYANLGFSVLYSIQVRITQVLLMIELVAFYFFLKAYRENKFKYWLFFALFLTLAFYQDYSTFWFFLIVNLFFAFCELFKRKKDKQKIKNWFVANFIFFLLYLPWLMIFFKNLENIPYRLTYLKSPNLKSVADLLASQIFGFEWAFYRLRESLKATEIWIYLLVLFPFVSATIFLGYKFLSRSLKILDKKAILLLFCFFLPLIFSFLIRQFLPIFQDRNLAIFSLSPILSLTLALKISRRWLTKIFLIFLISLFIYFNLCTINFLKENPLGVDWRGAALYLGKNLQKEDLLVAHQDGFLRPMEYYLNYRYDYDFKGKNIRFVAFELKEKEELFTHPKEGRYWLFIDSWWEDNVAGNFWEHFLKESEKWGIQRDKFHLQRKENIGGVVIYEVIY